MSKEMTLIVLGLWIVVVPYLGVPGSWRTAILILSGLAIALVGFLLRAEGLARKGVRSAHHPFVENFPAEPESETLLPVHDRKEGITSLN